MNTFENKQPLDSDGQLTFGENCPGRNCSGKMSGEILREKKCPRGIVRHLFGGEGELTTGLLVK